VWQSRRPIIRLSALRRRECWSGRSKSDGLTARRTRVGLGWWPVPYSRCCPFAQAFWSRHPSLEWARPQRHVKPRESQGQTPSNSESGASQSDPFACRVSALLSPSPALPARCARRARALVTAARLPVCLRARRRTIHWTPRETGIRADPPTLGCYLVLPKRLTFCLKNSHRVHLASGTTMQVCS
jgi:hypothetical protein